MIILEKNKKGNKKNPDYVLCKIISEKEYHNKFKFNKFKLVNAEDIYKINSWSNFLKFRLIAKKGIKNRLDEKNILITGVAGFIGFHLAKSLLKKNFQIIGIDKFSKSYETKIKKLRTLELKNTKIFLFIEMI